MADYTDMKTKSNVTMDGKVFIFPSTGAKMLLKARPPIAKEVNTD